MLRIATSPDRRGRFPGDGEVFANKKYGSLHPIARTNAAVSVVPPKLPAYAIRRSLLCALPVESTAAITSGARLPLLPHPVGSGGSSRGFVRGSFSVRLPPARTRCKRTLSTYFSRSTLFLPALYHGSLSVSTQCSHFCAVCPGWGLFCAQLRHNPYKTLPSHCRVKPCSAIRWARTSSIKWQSR